MKVHYDAEAYHGRVRTACGASAQRTREHAKVTCAQCLCTKAFKSGPRTKAHRMGYHTNPPSVSPCGVAGDAHETTSPGDEVNNPKDNGLAEGK